MRMDTRSNNNSGMILAVLAILVAAVLYAWILPNQWVTPDEGGEVDPIEKWTPVVGQQVAEVKELFSV